MHFSTSDPATYRRPAARALVKSWRIRAIAWRPSLASVLAWIALIVFAGCATGLSIAGRTTFLDTELLSSYAPWSSTIQDTEPPTNGMASDTVDSVYPQSKLLSEELRMGEFAQWNPYESGGSELGGLPNSGMFSPLSLPLWVAPGAYALGVVKLGEIALIALGMSVFLRRFRLPSATWAIASLAYAASGFMFSWTDWPQTRVAAFIPLLFWAIDRLAVRTRWRDALPAAAVIACLLLGGFPAVTGYALYASFAFGLYRAIAHHRSLSKVVRAATLAVLALIGGLALSAFEMVPFAINALTVVDFSSRAQTAAAALTWQDLGTVLIGGFIGGPGAGGWWGGNNPIEAFAYVGCGVCLLAFASLLLRGRKGNATHVLFFAIALGLCVALTFGGGVLLAAAETLPVFSTNFVGRLRVMIGFFAGVLAAFGFAAALDPSPQFLRIANSPHTKVRVLRWVERAIVIAAGGGLVAVIVRYFRSVPASARAQVTSEIVWTGCAIVVLAGAIMVARCIAAPWAKVPVAILVPLTIVVPAIFLVGSWWGGSSESTFYPQTASHRYLEKHIGNDRLATVGPTMLPGTNAAYGLRSVGGHVFTTDSWKDLLLAADPDSMLSATYSTFSAANIGTTIHSPILDRLAVKYVVEDPSFPLIGQAEASDLAPGKVATAAHSISSLQHTGPIRGLSFTMASPVSAAKGATVMISIRSVKSGKTLASTSTWVSELSDTRTVALAAEGIGKKQKWVAQLTVTGNSRPMTVDATKAGTLAVALTRPLDDSLRIVHTGDATIYKRTSALERIHWASTAVVASSDADEVALMANPTLPASVVVLDSRTSAPAMNTSSSARVKETDQSTDSMRIAVTASGSGWVVIEDSLRRSGWTATVDGKPTTIDQAEHAGGAIHVTAGKHVIQLNYETPGLRAGAAVTAAAIVLVLGCVAALTVARYRRKRSTLKTKSAGP